MADKNEVDQRIYHVLEKIKNVIERKAHIKFTAIKSPPMNSSTENHVLFIEADEKLNISPGVTIKDKKLDNLNWINKDYQELTFKNCTISDSNFSGSIMNGLRFENCNVFNCNFEKASIQDGYFEDSIFYEKLNQHGCNFSSADLSRAAFHRCNISMNNFTRAKVFQITIDDS